jgi:hypothetical protein
MWIKRLKIIFLLLLFATTVLGYILTKRFNPPHGLKGYYYPILARPTCIRQTGLRNFSFPLNKTKKGISRTY